MPALVRLRAQFGSDEANFGTERYRVDNDGTVLVSVDAAPSLLHNGGFTMADDPRPAVPAGMVMLVHPLNIGCSYGGLSYEPDGEGCVLVPAGATEQLAAHGFEPPGARSAAEATARDAVIADIAAAVDAATADLRLQLDAANARADAAEAARAPAPKPAGTAKPAA